MTFVAREKNSHIEQNCVVALNNIRDGNDKTRKVKKSFCAALKNVRTETTR